MYGATRAELKLEGTIRGACNGALKSKQFFNKRGRGAENADQSSEPKAVDVAGAGP